MDTLDTSDPVQGPPLSLRAALDPVLRGGLERRGWANIRPRCEFILDYEIDEGEWGTKKKPYRYRWPDDVRDEVLGRLLELNRVRAEEERLAGTTAERPSTPSSGKVRRIAKAKRVAEGGLFDDPCRASPVPDWPSTPRRQRRPESGASRCSSARWTPPQVWPSHRSGSGVHTRRLVSAQEDRFCGNSRNGRPTASGPHGTVARSA